MLHFCFWLPWAVLGGPPPSPSKSCCPAPPWTRPHSMRPGPPVFRQVSAVLSICRLTVFFTQQSLFMRLTWPTTNNITYWNIRIKLFVSIDHFSFTRVFPRRVSVYWRTLQKGVDIVLKSPPAIQGNCQFIKALIFKRFPTRLIKLNEESERSTTMNILITTSTASLCHPNHPSNQAVFITSNSSNPGLKWTTVR